MSRCVRCGRQLRSPSSIRRGAGPACAKLLLRQVGVEGRIPRGWSASSDERVQRLLATGDRVDVPVSTHDRSSDIGVATRQSARITATDAKRLMMDAGVPARHRELLLFRLPHVTREYRFSNEGEELETRRTRTVVGRLFRVEDVERAIEEYKANPDMARQWDEQIRQERAAERARRGEEQAREEEAARAAEEQMRRDRRDLELAAAKIAELEARLRELENERNRELAEGGFEAFLRSIEQWASSGGQEDEVSTIRTQLHTLREFTHWLEQKLENPAHRYAAEQVEAYRRALETMLD